MAQRILHAFYMQSTCSRSENEWHHPKAIASAYEVVWFLDRLLVCYYSGPCKSTRPWLVSLRCEVACLCYITETIICLVYEHSVQSRWLLDVNRGNSYISMAVYILRLDLLIGSSGDKKFNLYIQPRSNIVAGFMKTVWKKSSGFHLFSLGLP